MSGSLWDECLCMLKLSYDEMTKLFTKKPTALEVLPDGDALTDRTALVTGAASGIGVETVRALATAGCNVILCARNVAQGQAIADELKASGVRGGITVAQLDLADLHSVRACADAVLQHPDSKLDLLILNAGVMASPLTRTAQGFETQIGVNHIGHFYLTSLLLPKVKAGGGGRVVAVSSEGHRMGAINLEDMSYEHRPYSRWGAYGQSKLANILFAKELARRMEAEAAPVTAYSLHPGIIPTRLSRHMGIGGWVANTFGWPFMKSVEQGAATTLTAATAPGLPNGAYLKDCAVALPSKQGQDGEMATKLWEKTQELIDAALGGDVGHGGAAH